MKPFEQLSNQLRETARVRPEGSSTVARLGAGAHHIGKKVVERITEVWMAAEHENTGDAALEISQLLYHPQVMVIALDLDSEGVYRHL